MTYTGWAEGPFTPLYLSEAPAAICPQCGGHAAETTFRGEKIYRCHGCKYEWNVPKKDLKEEGYTKKAIIRDPNAPVGQNARMHLMCTCGNKVDMGMGDEWLSAKPNKLVTCSACGKKYDMGGYIKESYDDLDSIAAGIKKLPGVNSVSVEGGHSPFIEIRHTKGIFVFGGNADTWGADYYESETKLDNGEPSNRGAYTKVPSSSKDVDRIVQEFGAALAAFKK